MKDKIKIKHFVFKYFIVAVTVGKKQCLFVVLADYNIIFINF